MAAKKRDGSLRLCVNLSDVNKAIIPDTYPLPTTDKLTYRIAGSTVFEVSLRKIKFLPVLSFSLTYITIELCIKYQH